jgi:hypothetical protein
MPIPSGASYYGEFVTSNPSTGSAQNADSLPVATATHNGADDATFTLTVTNLATGRYKITGTVPGGYSSGDYVQISVAATVNTIAGVAVIDNFTIGALALTAAQIATGIFQDTTAGDFTVPGSIGKSLFTSGFSPGAANGLAVVGSNMGTVLGIAGVTFPPNFNLLSISGSGSIVVGAYASGLDPATLVLDVSGGAHNTAGTIGALINASGMQGDPNAAAVPGAYAVGTVGYRIGHSIAGLGF